MTITGDDCEDLLARTIDAREEELTAAKARIAELETERDDYKDAYEDTKRLAREIDVAMHGDAAAQQASLCDLIPLARQLKAERDEAYRLVVRLADEFGKHVYTDAYGTFASFNEVADLTEHCVVLHGKDVEKARAFVEGERKEAQDNG